MIDGSHHAEKGRRWYSAHDRNRRQETEKERGATTMYPCPTFLTFFAGRRGSFHPAILWRTAAATSGQLMSPETAAWRRDGPRSNGSKGPAYVTHRAGRAVEVEEKTEVKD